MLEGVMRTSITLDEELVAEVMKVTPAKTKTRSVTIALKEYVKRKRIEKLRSLLGNVDNNLVSFIAFSSGSNSGLHSRDKILNFGLEVVSYQQS